jgi:hypothetical protein
VVELGLRWNPAIQKDSNSVAFTVEGLEPGFMYFFSGQGSIARFNPHSMIKTILDIRSIPNLLKLRPKSLVDQLGNFCRLGVLVQQPNEWPASWSQAFFRSPQRRLDARFEAAPQRGQGPGSV